MAQDDLKPYNSRPGEANIKGEQPEKSEERYPTHYSRLDEQGKVADNRQFKSELRSAPSNIQRTNSRREYRIW